VYARAVSLSSRQATVEAVLSAMEGAALAHVASHGRFRADNPLFSSLELADGALTVYDIERLRRVPRTMVLSACDAGLPAARPGNEIMGLVAALLAAGTRTVLASTGLVPDTVSTLDLMTDFHSRLVAGERPAGALAAAQSRFEPLSPEGLAACSFVCFGRS
jgi:CHAT domain-containing protein